MADAPPGMIATPRSAQGQQVVLGRHLMRGRIDDVVRFQAGLELFDHLTFGVDQQGLRRKIPELDSVSAREAVSPIDGEVKCFREKREGIEARPWLIKRTGDCQLRRALFEIFSDLGARAATQLQLQAREGHATPPAASL